MLRTSPGKYGQVYVYIYIYTHIHTHIMYRLTYMYIYVLYVLIHINMLMIITILIIVCIISSCMVSLPATLAPQVLSPIPPDWKNPGQSKNLLGSVLSCLLINYVLFSRDDDFRQVFHVGCLLSWQGG